MRENRSFFCRFFFRRRASFAPVLGLALLLSSVCEGRAGASAQPAPQEVRETLAEKEPAVEQPALQTVRYRGIRPTDPGGRGGLRNPERGWRTETIIGEEIGDMVGMKAHHLRGKVPKGYREDWWVLDAQRYEPYGLTLIQGYCYLEDFAGKPLSEEKIELLRACLQRVRDNGWKVLLRFAYEQTMEPENGPTLQDVLLHLDQMAPVVQEYADVIYALQAGCVGAWGEWHHSFHGLEKDPKALGQIVEKILEILPEGRMTQVRVPRYKKMVLNHFSTPNENQPLDAASAHQKTPRARIGFHNDGFLEGKTSGWTWTQPPHFAAPGNPDFDYMTDESAYVAVDGELFWSYNDVPGLKAIERMRLHHYGSFSLAHSYSGMQGGAYSVDEWMKQTITIQDLAKLRLPVSDGYFYDQYGEEQERTVFEYITDHLGYRFELEQASFPKEMKKSQELSFEATVINRGFSTLHNPRTAYLLLIHTSGSVYELPMKEVKLSEWQPFQPGNVGNFTPLKHQISFQTALPQEMALGWYQLALWLPDEAEVIRFNPNYAIRFANGDIPFWTDRQHRYGANLLGTFEIKE